MTSLYHLINNNITIISCVLLLLSATISLSAPIPKVTRLVEHRHFNDSSSSSSSTTNYLFRTSAPIKKTPNGSIVFDWNGTLDLFARVASSAGVHWPSDQDSIVMADIDLMSDVYSDDPPYIHAEKSFFEENPHLGTFYQVPLVGDFIAPEYVDKNILLLLLQNWTSLDTDGRLLLEWAPKLKTMLETPVSSKNLVIVVHCLHGDDRTGEMMNSYMMKNHNWSLEQALKWDYNIVGVLPHFVRIVSMKWYCLYLNVFGNQKVDCKMPW